MRKVLSFAAVLGLVLLSAGSAQAQYPGRGSFSGGFRQGVGFAVGARLVGGFGSPILFAPQPFRQSFIQTFDAPVLFRSRTTRFVELIEDRPPVRLIEEIGADGQRRLFLVR